MGLKAFRSGQIRTRMPAGKGKKKCKTCGFRIRGKIEDHENGRHHQHTKFAADAKGNPMKMSF